MHKHTEAMNANIAELIMGLDDVTAGFSKDFEQMRSNTGWESFVGIFARGTGLAYGEWKQLIVQLVIAVVALVYTAIITAIIGAPFFIWIVRRQKVREL